MHRTKLHATGETDTDAAVAALLTRLGTTCPTCDDLVCLDCAGQLAHDRCVRACPDCSRDAVDWDQAWETSSLLTELRGLERVDDAIRAL